MKNYFVLLLAGSLLFLHSCTTDNEKVSTNTLCVDAKGELRKLRFSDLYSELKYIRLETSQESLISQVYKIIPFADRLLVVDRELGKILVFGSDGKFISIIGNKGAGPEEYVGISDVSIDPSGKRIFVLDDSQRQVQVYGTDGSYHERIPVDFVAHELEFLYENMLLFYCDYSSNEKYSRNGKRPNVLLMDFNKGEIMLEAYVPNEISVGEVSSPFSSLSGMNGNKAVLFDVLTNQLSFWGRKGVESILTIDFGEQDKVDKYIEMLRKERLSAVDIVPGESKSQPYTILLSCLPNKNYCLLNAMNYSTGEVYQIAYSPVTGKCLSGKGKRAIPVINDMDKYPPFMPYSSTEDCMYGIIEPYMILDGDNVLEGKTDLLEGLKEDDNPIVVVAKTKPI